ncbi:MAG: hypothetical protein D6739_09285 [Nitrospirae bacterium]|nr:MAG: hypothetical protein D6739_09285 [Nitrospirota bacterium]
MSGWNAVGGGGRVALPVAVALLLAGCVSLGGLEPPELSLAGLEVAQANLLETGLAATVRLVNPNPEPLEVSGLELRLYLGGLKVGRAVSAASVEVPRLGSVKVPLEVYVSNVRLLTRLEPLLRNRSLSWRIKGKLFVVTRWGTRRLPVSSEGMIDLGAEVSGREAPAERKSGTERGDGT